jgi:hypothetical protein
MGVKFSQRLCAVSFNVIEHLKEDTLMPLRIIKWSEMTPLPQPMDEQV